MNAIAIGLDGKIIDLFGGKDDIKNKLIRAVNPEVFADDPLRMLRAVQFSSRFNFNYDEKTYNLIVENAHLIREITAERILDELEKVFKKGNKAKCLKDMMQTGLYAELFDIKIVPNFDEFLIKEFESGTSLADFYYSLLKPPSFFTIMAPPISTGAYLYSFITIRTFHLLTSLTGRASYLSQ